MASGGGARAAFFSARAAACTTGDSAAEAAPTAARAITNKREIVMIAFCAGVYQSLSAFFRRSGQPLDGRGRFRRRSVQRLEHAFELGAQILVDRRSEEHTS